MATFDWAMNMVGAIYRPENDQVYLVVEPDQNPGRYMFMQSPQLTETFKTRAVALGSDISAAVDEFNGKIRGDKPLPAGVSREALERSIATFGLNSPDDGGEA